jgi:CMP-N-acetylneuraminic acid synthetase
MFMDKKLVAMIPARIDSKRIPMKNLRYLGDRLLVEHISDTCKSSGIFDRIYINSPDELMEKIAQKNNIFFYMRKHWFEKRPQTNDDFTYEFISNISTKTDCDICVLANPTSPFLTVDDFHGFMNFMIQGKFETVLTVKDMRAQCLYKEKPVNYLIDKKMAPTQNLTPVRMLANGIMAWDIKSFLKRWDKYDCASLGHGGTIGYYPLTGYSTLDIDWEEDFLLAEQIIKMGKDGKYYEPK